MTLSCILSHLINLVYVLKYVQKPFKAPFFCERHPVEFTGVWNMLCIQSVVSDSALPATAME